MERVLMHIAVALLIIVFGSLFWFMIRSNQKMLEAVDQKWGGAVIVRICPDGTHIFRLKDGRFFTGGNSQVENPDTVCVWPKEPR